MDRWEMRDSVVSVLKNHIPGNPDGESANNYRERLEVIADDIVSTIERNLREAS